jgi:hypothetical protein
MILHIVLFNLREGSPVAEVEAKLRTLGALPMVRSVVIGRCIELEEISPALRSREYQHAAVFTFDSEEDVRAYVRHPTHQEVAAELRARFAGAKIIDVRIVEGG